MRKKLDCEHLCRWWKKKRSQPGHNPKRWPAPDSILFAAPRVLHFQTTCVLYSQIPSAAAPVVGQVLWALVYVMTAKQHTHTVRLTDLLHGQHCGKPKLNHYQHFHLLNWHAAGCKILFHGSVQRAQESKHCVWRPGSCHAIGNIPTTKNLFFFFYRNYYYKHIYRLTTNQLWSPNEGTFYIHFKLMVTAICFLPQSNHLSVIRHIKLNLSISNCWKVCVDFLFCHDNNVDR